MVADRINTLSRRLPTWVIYIATFAGIGWLFFLGLSGQLGPEPVNALEREYGELALKLLIVGLIISPLRSWTGVNLIRFRRAIGLSAFAFVVAHLSVWAILDLRELGRVLEELTKRPYIIIGTLSFLALIPLAVTSNDRSLRKLGPKWRKLHLLTYPAVILAGLHFVWLVKGFPTEPLIYMLVIVGLLIPRYLNRRKRQKS